MHHRYGNWALGIRREKFGIVLWTLGMECYDETLSVAQQALSLGIGHWALGVGWTLGVGWALGIGDSLGIGLRALTIGHKACALDIHH